MLSSFLFACTSRDIVSSKCNKESREFVKYKAQTLWSIYSKYYGFNISDTGRCSQYPTLHSKLMISLA